MRVTKFQQVRLLLWKNFVLQKRRPVGTLFEIFVPIALFIVLIGVRNIYSSTNKPETAFCSQYIAALDYSRELQFATAGTVPSTSRDFPCSTNIDLTVIRKYNAIGFAPNTAETRQLIDYMRSLFNTSFGLNITFVGFNDAEQISHLSENQGELLFYAGEHMKRRYRR